MNEVIKSILLCLLIASSFSLKTSPVLTTSAAPHLESNKFSVDSFHNQLTDMFNNQVSEKEADLVKAMVQKDVHLITGIYRDYFLNKLQNKEHIFNGEVTLNEKAEQYYLQKLQNLNIDKVSKNVLENLQTIIEKNLAVDNEHLFVPNVLIFRSVEKIGKMIGLKETSRKDAESAPVESQVEKAPRFIERKTNEETLLPVIDNSEWLPVPHDQPCGNCWTEATSAILTSALKQKFPQKYGETEDMIAPQMIMDCINNQLKSKFTANGCDGGHLKDVGEGLNFLINDKNANFHFMSNYAFMTDAEVNDKKSKETRLSKDIEEIKGIMKQEQAQGKPKTENIEQFAALTKELSNVQLEAKYRYDFGKCEKMIADTTNAVKFDFLNFKWGEYKTTQEMYDDLKAHKVIGVTIVIEDHFNYVIHNAFTWNFIYKDKHCKAEKKEEKVKKTEKAAEKTAEEPKKSQSIKIKPTNHAVTLYAYKHKSKLVGKKYGYWSTRNSWGTQLNGLITFGLNFIASDKDSGCGIRKETLTAIDHTAHQ